MVSVIFSQVMAVYSGRYGLVPQSVAFMHSKTFFYIVHQLAILHSIFHYSAFFFLSEWMMEPEHVVARLMVVKAELS